MIGITLGVAGSAAISRYVHSFLYGISAFDPLTFATVIVVLASVALLASYVPARRAAKVDPIVTLRSE
jgi:ABC-type antimicrobial peptide transport system permease subunit